MSNRHSMISITYNWENEKAIVKYSPYFNSYSKLQKLDSLKDVIYILQNKYDYIIDNESYLD